MGKVVVLTTGGTISSSLNKSTGLLTTGSINGKQLIELCEIDKNKQVEVEEVFRIPSNHYTYKELFQLKEKIESIFTDEQVDGIVITHGTDTLEETAYFLDLVTNFKRPIVITGSQRSSTQLGSDAQMNIRQAVDVASDEKSKNLGVLVLFNEEIYSARDVMKIHSSNVSAFSSLGYGKLGVVDYDDVIYYRKPIASKKYPLSKPVLSSVDLISCCLGCDERFIEAAIQSGAEGIVIEGFGRGHVPPVMIPNIKEAINKGIIVVITSRTLEGRVYPVYDFPGGVQHLMEQGVILGGSLSGCKARLKLAVLLSLYGNNKEKIIQEFKE